MEVLVEFGKIILPAGGVLYAMFLTTRLFLNKEYDKRLIDIKIKNSEIILPLRFQAYERICLFLERISPKNIIVRLNVGKLTARDLHQMILDDIREEFGHNLSQQVYMSEQAWDSVKNAMEEVVILVNESVGELEPDSMSIDLARKVFENVIEKQQFGTEEALYFVKNEIQQVF